MHIGAADDPQGGVGIGDDGRVAADGPRRAVAHFLGDDAHAVLGRLVLPAHVAQDGLYSFHQPLKLLRRFGAQVEP